MKRLSNLLASLVFASLVIFMSCGGGKDDPAPTVEELAATDLVGKTWTVNASSITFADAPDPDGFWDDFTLTFSGDGNGGNFSTSGVPTLDDGFADVWPASGTWEFVVNNNRVTGILRGDGIEMATTLTAEALTLEFQVASPPSRTSGIYDDDWSFTFSVQ